MGSFSLTTDKNITVRNVYVNITVCDIFVSRKIEGSRSLIWHEGSD